jgi:hypothetical protein
MIIDWLSRLFQFRSEREQISKKEAADLSPRSSYLERRGRLIL